MTVGAPRGPKCFRSPRFSRRPFGVYMRNFQSLRYLTRLVARLAAANGRSWYLVKQVLVKGELRHEVGKGAARKARARGQVPAVIYGKGKGTTLINLSGREFSRAVQAGL
ncbi:MAG: hypothetical protein ACOYW4_02605, partial [Bacillota bacterium]